MERADRWRYAHKTILSDPGSSQALAPIGDLCPSSKTSVAWKSGPIKPEVVFEGGNRVYNPPDSSSLRTTELELLTTGTPPGRLFDSSAETSAATALASKMAAEIMAYYPDLWPETVRGLIVHSAEWTSAMWNSVRNQNSKTEKSKRLRRYGYGVPNLSKALNSFEENVSLIIQGSFKPFKLEGSTIKTDEMAMHKFPWPRESLAALADVDVKLRITLSYFIEPNPGKRGWKTDPGYRSHGLRFELKSALQTPEDFQKMISRHALEEGEKKPLKDKDENWFFGQEAKTRGSIHSDIWKGSVAELAERDFICISPVRGWWRTRKHLHRHENQARYSLIVSLEAPLGTQLYTEIKSQIDIPTLVTT